jgi:hypothetical protein
MRPTITSVDIDGARIAAEVDTILRTRAAAVWFPTASSVLGSGS